MNLDRYEQGPDGSLRNTTQEPEEPVTTPVKKPDPPPSFTGTPHTAPDNSLEYQDEQEDDILNAEELDEFHDYEDHEMPQIVQAPAVTPPATAASVNKDPTSHKRTRSAPASAMQKITSSRTPGDVIVLGGPKHQRTRSLDSPQKAASAQMLRKSASTDTASRKSAKSSTKKKTAAAAGGAAVVGGAATAGVLASKAPKASDQEVPTNFTPAVVPDRPQSTARSLSPKMAAGADPESPMKGAVAGDMGKKNMAGGNDPIGPSAINHNFTTQPKKKTIMGMSRPVFAALSLAAAGAAGLGVWTAMELPNLNGQVRDLEEQVERLSKEVDRLEEENDRFQASNDQLNASIAFFDEQNEFLNETAIRLDDSVDDLTDQVEELVEINAQIAAANLVIQAENAKLNATNQELYQDVNNLTDTVDVLEATFMDLSARNQELKGNITELTVLRVTLEQTEAELEASVTNITELNDSLQASLDDLDETVQYLNNSITGTQAEKALITAETAEMVETNRFIGIEELNYNYLDGWHGWDCGFAQTFGDVLKDDTLANAPMSPTLRTNVLAYMNTEFSGTNIFCFNHTDMVNFYDVTYGLDMTILESIDGTNIYVEEGLKYYFPDQGEAGLSPSDWEAASYACANISPKFEYPLP